MDWGLGVAKNMNGNCNNRCMDSDELLQIIWSKAGSDGIMDRIG